MKRKTKLLGFGAQNSHIKKYILKNLFLVVTSSKIPDIVMSVSSVNKYENSTGTGTGEESLEPGG